MVYANKRFNTPLLVEEVAQIKSTLESVEKMFFTPRPGQSAVDVLGEKRKIVNVTKEISAML